MGKLNQLWLLYQHNKTKIAHHEPKKLTLYSPQKITEQDRFLIDFKNEYPISQYYYNPIRKLDRLTFNLDKQNGDSADVTASVFVFKFVCKNKNLGC